MPDDELSDFEATTFAHDGKERVVFGLGVGPAVIVIAEMHGITPKVAEFARRVPGVPISWGMAAVQPIDLVAASRPPRDRARVVVALTREMP